MAPSTFRSAAGGLALLIAALAQPAAAQSILSNSAEYNAGYGRYPGQENRPTEFGSRDANSNRTIIDGIIQTGEDQSFFSSSSGVGSSSGGGTAIGNNLVVVTQGNYNTVIVNSSQVNNGDVTAGVTVSGVGDAQ